MGDCPLCPAIPLFPIVAEALATAGAYIGATSVGVVVGAVITENMDAIKVGLEKMAASGAMGEHQYASWARELNPNGSPIRMSSSSNGGSGKSMEKNRTDGKAREAKTEKELKQENPDSNIQNERYLRDKDGKIVKDPKTGEGRRVDHAVIKDGKVTKLVETTSNSAPKNAQSLKEERIREQGGTYIRDKTDKKKLYDVSNVPTETRRQN